MSQHLPTNEAWMLMQAGEMQMYPLTVGGKSTFGWLLCDRKGLAMQLAEWLDGSGIHPVRIPSGEAMEQIEAIVWAAGGRIILSPLKFDARGEPVWAVLPMRNGGAA